MGILLSSSWKPLKIYSINMKLLDLLFLVACQVVACMARTAGIRGKGEAAPGIAHVAKKHFEMQDNNNGARKRLSEIQDLEFDIAKRKTISDQPDTDESNDC